MIGLATISLGVLCGSVIYKMFKWTADDDAVSDAETSDYSVIISVAKRLEKLYGGTAYVGLRIPDPETLSRQNIDIVLVKNGEAVVISVKNISGVVSIDNDGRWLCMGEVVHPDPVEEVVKQASILESYLEQRGIPAGERRLSYKVILPNPKLCPISLNLPDVITYDQWMQLKPERPKLNFILGTAPMWDRLQLEGNRFVLGEFLEFKGEQEDTLVLRCIKRSDVSSLRIQKPGRCIKRSDVSSLRIQKPVTALSTSTLNVLYSHRDFRAEGESASEWMQLTVTSNTEVLFRPENSNKVHKFKLSTIVSLVLGA